MKKCFLFLCLITLLASCSKERYDDQLNDVVEARELTDPGNTVQALPSLDFSCPAQDYPCSMASTLLEDMFGDLDPDPFNIIWGNGSAGIIDGLLNCPPVAIELCDRDCSLKTVEIDPYEAVVLDQCNDGSDQAFTVAEQRALVARLKTLAVNYAPRCGNRVMIPISYDAYVRYTSFASVRLIVTYKAPCNPGPFTP